MATIPALIWIGVYDDPTNTAVLVFTSEELAAAASAKLSGDPSGRLNIYGPLRTSGLRPRIGEEVPVRYRLGEVAATVDEAPPAAPAF